MVLYFDYMIEIGITEQSHDVYRSEKMVNVFFKISNDEEVYIGDTVYLCSPVIIEKLYSYSKDFVKN